MNFFKNPIHVKFDFHLILRIFTIGGSQLAPICLPASPITLTARNGVFALVYNALGCGLSCRIYNTSQKKLLVETQVCISELSELKWVGLSDKGVRKHS